MAKKRGKAKGSNPKSGLIPKYKKIKKMDFTYERFAQIDLWPITPGITADGQHLSDNVKGIMFCDHFGYACWEQDGSVLLTGNLPDESTNKTLSAKELIRWRNRDNEEAKFNQLLDAAFRSRTLENFGNKERPEVNPFEFLTWLIQKGYPLPNGLIEKWKQSDHDEFAEKLRLFHEHMMYLIEHGKNPPGTHNPKKKEKKKIKKVGRKPHSRIEQIKKAAIALRKKHPKMTIEKMTYHQKITTQIPAPSKQKPYQDFSDKSDDKYKNFFGISRRTVRGYISDALKSQNSS